MADHSFSFEQSDCERCFDCVTACPRGVLERGELYPIVAHPEECMGCRVCLGVCRKSLGKILGPYIATLTVQCYNTSPERKLMALAR